VSEMNVKVVINANSTEMYVVSASRCEGENKKKRFSVRKRPPLPTFAETWCFFCRSLKTDNFRPVDMLR
jgi:hypothetical protein